MVFCGVRGRGEQQLPICRKYPFCRSLTPDHLPTYVLWMTSSMTASNSTFVATQAMYSVLQRVIKLYIHDNWSHWIWPIILLSQSSPPHNLNALLFQLCKSPFKLISIFRTDCMWLENWLKNSLWYSLTSPVVHDPFFAPCLQFHGSSKQHSTSQAFKNGTGHHYPRDL